MCANVIRNDKKVGGEEKGGMTIRAPSLFLFIFIKRGGSECKTRIFARL